MISLTPASPANAPEISMVIMMTFLVFIPAYEAAGSLKPTERISYPHLVCQIYIQTNKDVINEMIKLKFKGDSEILIPNVANIACIVGIHADSKKVRLCGVILPGMINTFTSKYTIRFAAMKLNMIVVITIWLPLYACR